MSSTLLQFVHPALEKSRVNRGLLQRAETLDGVVINDLYEKYPDFHVDARAEQELMVAHDRVVFQFPFYWYSSPALLKEWFDIVLEYGWAYGKGGAALKGKIAKVAVSTGGASDSYTGAENPVRTMAGLLAPITQTLELCGMRWSDPFFVHGSLHKTPDELERLAEAYADWILKD